MKLLIISAAFSACLMAPYAYSENAATKPVVLTKRPTHDDIVRVQEKQKHEKHEHNKSRPLTEKPLVTIKKRSLIGSSTLLSNGHHWTLVPNGAVIHVPACLKDKVVTKPVGTLISWKKFLRNNYGWLHTHPIKMTQAQGREKIDQKAIKAYKTMGKIVVATCANGPISVTPKSLIPPISPEDESKALKR